MNQQRLEKLRAAILSHGLDGVALMPGPNMIYVSDIHCHVSERPIVLFIPADDDPAIIIPKLEAMKAEAGGIPAGRIFAWGDEEGYTGAFQAACAQLELSDYLLGVEALRMRVLESELLHRYAPGISLTHAEPITDRLRLSKDGAEIETLQRAAVVAETALRNLLPKIKIGQTEKQIAMLLTQELIAAGTEAVPFLPIVSAGPNAASPHAVPTTRPVQAGDLLVIDWGAMIDGYISDITRTFAIGQPETEFVQIYNLVREANEQGKRASRPGASGQDIDRAARAVIRKAGYGDYFIHRTGHGLGMETHEHPSLLEGNNDPLPIGAVFTVEPGIYIPGRVGVRIEDDVVITPDGHHSFTTLPRELMIIG